MAVRIRRTKESEMRKTLVAATVATVFSAGAFLAGGANAMTLTAPSGLRAATEGVTTADPVRYVCYRNRRGVRVCSWRRNVVAGAYPYYGYGYPAYGYGYGYPAYGYGYGYPGVGIGIGYGWGGGGWGWGGNRTVIRNRTIVRRGHR
jgi:hypothetical protein